MKFSASAASLLSVAPLAMATYGDSVDRRDGHMKGGHESVPVVIDPNVILENPSLPLDMLPGSHGSVIVIWVNMGAGHTTQPVNEQVTVTKTVTVHPTDAASTVVGHDGAITTVPPGGSALVPAPAATHTVTVGGQAGLVYTPDQLNAAVNDMIIFKFMSQNHTITQSTFNKPCVPMGGGMDSGFVPNPNNTVTPEPMVAMQVMTDQPIWMYCGQKGHCGKGMVFSLNPTAEKTHAMFQAAAIAQNGKGTPSPITGGSPAPPPPDAPAGVPLPPPSPPTESTPPVGEGATPTQSVSLGTGTILPDGSCHCAAVCGAGSFPAPGSQGLNAIGGMAGAIPVHMGMMV